MKRSILACLAGLFTWFVVVIVINSLLRASIPNYTACRTDAPVHTGHEVGPPCDGHRYLAGGRCNTYGLAIEPLGAVDRRQRGSCNVLAFAHRHLE